MEKDKDDLLTKAKEDFAKSQEYYSEEYNRGKEDVRFLFNVNNDQWPDAIKKQRSDDNRPCLTENRLLPFVHQLINDIRQSRPSIKVAPADSRADIETAKIYRGMVRNIENISGADNVYDTAAENAIQSGYGWIRVHVDYADDQSFDQEIYLKRVRNPFSVYFDPNSIEMDGSDAEFAFVFDDIPRKDFEAMYPDANPVAFSDGNDWCTTDTVRIAEYFYKEYTERTIVLDNGQVRDATEQDFDLPKRTVKVPVVKWCKLTGSEILEETVWPGKFIPIVPVYGEEVWHEGKRKAFSLIFQAKDPQRRFNYMLSSDTETLGLQPKAPAVGLRGQFRTSADKWATANIKNPAFLEFDPVELPDGTLYLNTPQRMGPPMSSPGFFNHMMAAGDGIKNTLGIFNASLGQEGNEKSGKAILARQAEGDNATFHFMDNLSTAIRQTGMIIIDLIPKVYSDARIVRILGEDGTAENVPVNQRFIEQGGIKTPVQDPLAPYSGIHDLGAGKYDVTVSTGPSYATKRQETTSFILEAGQAFPAIWEVGGDVFFENLDAPGAEIIAERLKKMLPPQLAEDDQDPRDIKIAEAEQAIQGMMQQIQQMEAMLKDKSENEQAKFELEKMKLALEEKKLMLEAAKTQAEVQTQIPAQAINDIAGAIDDLNNRVQDVTQVVDLILSQKEEEQAAFEPTEPQSSGIPV